MLVSRLTAERGGSSSKMSFQPTKMCFAPTIFFCPRNCCASETEKVSHSMRGSRRITTPDVTRPLTSCPWKKSPADTQNGLSVEDSSLQKGNIFCVFQSKDITKKLHFSGWKKTLLSTKKLCNPHFKEIAVTPHFDVIVKSNNVRSSTA